MKVKYVALLSIIALFFFTGIDSCERKVSSDKFSLPSVPEEGGIKFFKMTDINDDVRGPKVAEENVRKFFDISKDGLKMAYIANKNDKDNIYIKDIRPGIATKVNLQRTFREQVMDPTFSPDGKMLGYSEFRDGSWNIYMIGAETGSSIRQVTTSSLHEFSPVFVPSGNSIVFVQMEFNRSIIRGYLWNVNLDNGNLTQHAEGYMPSFSSDMKKVVVTRPNRDTGEGEIWLLDLEKSQDFTIKSQKGKSFISGTLSPDGKRIAIVARTNPQKNIPANLDIYLVDIDGGNDIQLTHHVGNDLCPRWSPDGKSIYFLSQRGSEKGEYNIWRMDLELTRK